LGNGFVYHVERACILLTILAAVTEVLLRSLPREKLMFIYKECTSLRASHPAPSNPTQLLW
jgi:hypothetical protein